VLLRGSIAFSTLSFALRVNQSRPAKGHFLVMKYTNIFKNSTVSGSVGLPSVSDYKVSDYQVPTVVYIYNVDCKYSKIIDELLSPLRIYF
jgi:hypothetical protein